MSIPELVGICSRDEQLRFLVIGGYAVIAHGYARFTHDLDFLIRRQQREQWVKKLKAVGFINFVHRQNFIQVSALSGGVDLDLMLVNDATFNQMWAEAKSISFGDVEARMTCLDHLLALKLHVIKQGLVHRIDKDKDDVKMLVRKNSLNIRSRRYQELFLKYGTAAIYEEVVETAGRR